MASATLIAVGSTMAGQAVENRFHVSVGGLLTESIDDVFCASRMTASGHLAPPRSAQTLAPASIIPAILFRVCSATGIACDQVLRAIFAPSFVTSGYPIAGKAGTRKL
jgi:hypothetical protein